MSTQSIANKFRLVLGSINIALLVFILGVNTTSAKTLSSDMWYLNVYGESGHYAIARFENNGLPNPITPVITKSSHDFDKEGVAWPSAIRTPSGEIYLYASGFDGKKWSAVGLWVSKDGVSFSKTGAVFAADSSEPYGVGPTYVFYSPESIEKFGMYYLIRGKNGPGQKIGFASSSDGIHWHRHGIAYSVKSSDPITSLSLSYACRDSNKTWVLVFPGYYKDGTQASFIATSLDENGPFSKRRLVMSPDKQETTVLEGRARANYIVVSDSSAVKPKHLYLIEGETPQNSEPVIALEIKGNTVFLNRPLLYDHKNQVIDSMERNKVDISYIKKNPKGWQGIATVYNPRGDVHAEYTVEIQAPSIYGPWKQSGKEIRFSPWSPEAWYSTENPSPITYNVSCD